MTTLITIAETQARLKLSRTKVLDLCDRGEITAVKIGSARRVVEASVDSYIDRLSEKTAAHRSEGDTIDVVAS